MKLEFFDAGDFATDGRHRISLRESRRRLNVKSNTISRLRKRVAELTQQRRELRLENRRLARTVDAIRRLVKGAQMPYGEDKETNEEEKRDEARE